MTVAAKKSSDSQLIYFKLVVFFGFFVLTSYVIKQDSYQTDQPKSWFRAKEATAVDTLLRLIYQNFLLSNNFPDIAKFMFRIVLASFLKDAVFAVFSPDKLRTPVPTRLISMVESETLDQSWIPVTEKEWQERSINKDNSKKTTHSFIYNFGKSSIGLIVTVGQFVASAWTKMVTWIEFILSALVSSALGMIVFIFRSLICTFSSIFLIILYTIQLVLRTVKQVYNVVLMGLTFICTMINDLSLLSVELIQRTVVLENEEVFVKLRNSIRTTGSDLGVKMRKDKPVPQ